MSRTSTLPVPAPEPPDAPGSAPQRRNPLVDFLEKGMELVDVDALIEAGELYGDDVERELADLEAGRHPLQRQKPAD